MQTTPDLAAGWDEGTRKVSRRVTDIHRAPGSRNTRQVADPASIHPLPRAVGPELGALPGMLVASSGAPGSRGAFGSAPAPVHRKPHNH